MTREETQARIVDAAFKALVEGGYHETSMKDIASEAGVATGLAHYYFESKEELLLAALMKGCPLPDLRLEGISGLEQARLGFASEREGMIWNSDAYKAVFEMVGVGMHNQRVAETLRRFFETRRALVIEISEAVLADAPAPARTGAKNVGAAIFSAFLGIALQRLIDPGFDGQGALDALEEMSMLAATASAPQPGEE